MQKRRLEITAQPAYICSTDGHKIFLREVPEEQKPKKRRAIESITDFVVMLGYYGLCVTGWVLALMYALNL